MALIKDRYQLEVDTRQAQANINGLKGALSTIGFAAAAAAVTQFGREIIESTRQFQTYTNQLRLITNSQAELESITNRLTVAARNNRAAFGDTVDLFTKLTLATAELGISQDRVLNVTNNFSQALAISGADANTAAGAIRQFGQAMASGTVRGDEFNSIVEALGPALAIMAQESGVTVGKLRQMSQAGELTAEVFFEMVESSTALNAAFNSTEETIGQLETRLGDSFDRMLVKIGEVSGITRLYEEQIRDLSRAFDFLAGAELAPVNLDIDQLRNFSETGITAAAALEELQIRLERVLITGGQLGGIFRSDAEAFKELSEAIEDVEGQMSAFNEAAEAADAQTEAIKQQEAALRSILEPHQQFIDQAQKFADTDYRTALEKANQRVIDAEIVIEQLNLAFERSNGQIDNFVFLLRGAENELAAAQEQVAGLKNNTDDLNESLMSSKSSFENFFDDLIEGSSAAVREQTNALMAVEALTEELRAGRINVDQYAEAMDRVNNILGRTGTAAKEAATGAQELNTQLSSAESFYRDLVDRARDNVREFENAGLAQDRLMQDLESGKINIDQYADAMQQLNRILGTTSSTTREVTAATYDLQGAIDDVNRSTADRIQQAQDRSELAGLRGIRRELRSIELQEKRTAEAAKRRITQQAEAAGVSVNPADLSAIDAASQRAIEVQQQLALDTYNNQRAFSTGWANAFDEYAEQATDAASQAQRIFEKTTRGMEDAIVGFAKTGKFEFKDFLATIAEEILRSQVRILIAKLFGGMGAGGQSGFGTNRFAGFFANGGMIPSGKFGIAGEAGPELITGPAQVTPLGMGGDTVTYNINAVDAPSFQQLVARDPRFIHAVSEKGRQSVSGVRR